MLSNTNFTYYTPITHYPKGQNYDPLRSTLFNKKCLWKAESLSLTASSLPSTLKVRIMARIYTSIRSLCGRRRACL